MVSTSAWRRAPIWRSTKVVEAGETDTRNSIYSGGAGYATAIRVPPRSVLDLRVSASPAWAGPACTVGEHNSRWPLPGRKDGLPAAFQRRLAAAVQGPARFLGRICSY